MKKKMVHLNTTPVAFKNNKWEYKTEEWEVNVLAISGKWAMVRRPGCVPLVVPTSTLVDKI